MSRHDARIRLRHMLDAAREASTYVAGKARADLGADRSLQLNLIALLSVVGEAASRVPPDERVRIPSVPWRQIVAMRNHLIHAYDQVDLDILWDTATRNLPPLIAALEAALAAPD